jgi:hypothetical protein
LTLSVKEKISEGVFVNKPIFFSENNIEVYKKMFNYFVETGATQNDFNDPFWTFNNYKEIKSPNNFNFELAPHLKHWLLPLKGFLLVCLTNKIKPKSIRFNHIIYALHYSYGFEDLMDLKIYYEEQDDQVCISLRPQILDLLKFVNRSDIEIEEVSNVLVQPNVERNQRKLPKLMDIILLNDGIDRFIEEWNTEEQIVYSPFILYWLLSNIIPMRPLEFFLMPRNCIVTINNDIFIKIPRVKEQYTYLDDVHIDTVPINDEKVISLIEQYKGLTNNNNIPGEFLLCYESYQQNMLISPKNTSLDNAKDVFLHKQLTSIRDRFYHEILQERYNLTNDTHQKIKLGDTRHLAICNMLFMGFSPITIMRMAMHKDVSAQNPYAAHMDLYAQSRVIQLTEVFRRAVERLWRGDTYNIDLIDDDLRNRRIFKREDFKYLWKLKHGSYCFYTPLDCPTKDCRSCRYLYIPEENWKEALPWLAEESDRLKGLIKETLEQMDSLRKVLSKELELKTKAGELDSLIHQKAMVDAHRKEVNRAYGNQTTTVLDIL